MSDRTIAGLIMLATAMFCWWLVHGYVREGEIVGRYGLTVTRADHPRRFWAVVILTALVALLPSALTVMAFL